ncbi:AAA family ATPase [Veillonella ratti]|uniref:AAA family ATPase n=1 Tax=Veillonella ratti TaxID=103892 RepID=UPI000F8D629D|nr:AAA family ATPase [Veillonella ratti]
MGKVIAIMSGKGGVGKTTMTAYIGAALNRRGHRVLITDADFGMRDLDLVIGKENDIFFDAVDIWKDNCNQDSAIIPLTDDFDFLPATQTRRWEDVGRKGYAKLIKKLAESYDFVIIDAPAGIGRGNEAVFKAADQLLLVAEPMWVSLRAVQRVMQLCHEERQFNYALILNNVGRSEVAVAVEEALATLQVEQLATILPHSTKLMGWAQDGTLHEFSDEAVDTMMVPLLEYIETSEVWPEEKLLDRWYQLQSAEETATENSKEAAKETTPTANTDGEAAETSVVVEAAMAEPMVDRIVEGERVEVETGEVSQDSVSAHSDVATQNELVSNGAKVGAVPAVSNVADEAAEDSAVEAKTMVEAVKTEMTAPVASSAKVAVDAAKSTAETAAAKAEDIVDSVTDKAEAVADAASEKAEAVAEKAEDLVETVTDKVEEVVATVEDKTEAVVDKAKEVAEETAAEIKAVTDESAEEKEEPAQPKKMSLFEVFKKKISSLWS